MTVASAARSGTNVLVVQEQSEDNARRNYARCETAKTNSDDDSSAYRNEEVELIQL
jgi:hypothetical protein